MKKEETLERVSFLREKKLLPYIMRDSKIYTSEDYLFWEIFSGWVNQPRFFLGMKFEDFFKNYRLPKNT